MTASTVLASFPAEGPGDEATIVHEQSVNRISLKNKLASYQTKHVDQLLNRKGITQH